MKSVLIQSALFVVLLAVLLPFGQDAKGDSNIFVYPTLSGVKCSPDQRALWIVNSGASAGVYRCSARDTFAPVGSSHITDDGTNVIVNAPLGVGGTPSAEGGIWTAPKFQVINGNNNHLLSYAEAASGAVGMSSWVGNDAGRVMRWSYQPGPEKRLEGFFGDEDGVNLKAGQAGLYFFVGDAKATAIIGDAYANANSTYVEAEDSAQTVRISASRVELIRLPPVYANNAAAIAGGLTAGMLYRTGGDPDQLCIVH